MTDEIPEDWPELDLLGDPVGLASEHLGRPEFEKTDEQQEVVRVLAASGWSQERIARQIGCDPKTLRKHFSRELEAAADDAEAEALVAIHRRAKEGNVTAARQVIALAEKGRAAPPIPKTAPAQGEEPDLEDELAGLGKKERKMKAAENPGSDWAHLLGPRVH